MQFTTALFALVASTLSVASAEPAHSHLHSRFHARELSKRATVVINSKISTLAGQTSNANAVAGTKAGYPFQNTIINNSTQDMKVVVWEQKGYVGFALPITAMNSDPPTPAVVLEVPSGEERTISFSSGFSGAYAGVFPDTGIQAGGGFDTAWVEITTWGQATGDVSFLPNMASKYVSLDTGVCVSDWTQCGFKCNDGSSSCFEAFNSELMPCLGKNYNFNAGPQGKGPWNGGCQLPSTFTTTFSEPL